jgi:hypothetical protein
MSYKPIQILGILGHSAYEGGKDASFMHRPSFPFMKYSF